MASRKQKKQPTSGGSAGAGPKLPTLWLALLLVVLPAVAYTLYVFDRQRELERYSLRALQRAAERLETVLGALEVPVRSLTRDFRDAEDFGERNPYLSERAGTHDHLMDLLSWEKELWGEREEQEEEDGQDEAKQTESQTRSPIAWLKRSTPADEMSRADLAINFEGRLCVNNSSLVLGGYVTAEQWPTSLERSATSARGECWETDEEAGTQRLRPLAFDVELEGILRTMFPDHVFDHVVFGASDGQILAQVDLREAFTERPRGVRVSDLRGLALQSPNPGTEDEHPQADPSETFAESWHAARSSIAREIELAGEPYRTFCQPLDIEELRHAQDNAEKMPPVLCAIVPSDRILKQALAVKPFWGVLMFLSVFLGLLATPFVKLSVMHRRERFRFVDATFLLSSTFTSTMVLTVLIVGVASYAEFRSGVEDKLEALAKEVEARFVAELGLMYDQLDSFGQIGQVAREVPANESSPGLLTRENLFDPTPGARLAPPPKLDLYLATRMIFATDEKGEQLAKATVRPQNTPAVNVAKRDYFSRVRERSVFRLPDGRATHLGHREFFFEAAESMTTGQRFTALSRAAAAEGDWAGVVVLTSTLGPRSVVAPVLPPGYAVSLIDPRTERSLFSSVPGQALFENVFEKLENHHRLESAVASRTARTFSGQYALRPHLIHVRPVSGLPWSIVTRYDLELTKATGVEAFIRVGVTALPYVIVLNVLLWASCLALRFFHPRYSAWLWPSEANQVTYQRIVLSMLALLVALAVAGGADADSFCLASFYLPDPLVLYPPLTFVLACGFAAFAHFLVSTTAQTPTTAVAPKPEQSKEKSEWKLELPFVWYQALALLFWILVAVLPAVGFSRAAWNEQIRTLRKYQAVDAFAALGRREAMLREHFREISHADQVLDDLLAGPCSNGIDEPCDLYLGAVFDTRVEWAIERSGTDHLPTYATNARNRAYLGASAAAGWVDRLPIYNTSVGGLRYLNQDASVDGYFNSTGQGRLRFTPARASDSSTSSIESAAIAKLHLGPSSALGGGLLLLALWYWNRSCARRILFTRLRSQVPARALFTWQKLVEADLRRPAFAVMASPRDRATLAKSCGLVSVNLAQIDEEAEMRVRALPTDQRIVCGYFEIGLEDPKTRAWKLELLEILVLRKRTKVIVPVAFNPIEHLFWFASPSNGADDEAEGAHPTARAGDRPVVHLGPHEARRWARLLGEFAVAPVTISDKFYENPDKKSNQWLVSKGLKDISTRLGHRDEMRERMLEVHEGFFWALWSACTTDEQLVLVHLAHEKLVNPRQARAVRALLRRGLLEAGPPLKLMNESFRLFVERIHEPVEVARWEQTASRLGWHDLRWVFLGPLVLVALFLATTQKELFNATLGVISAILVGGAPRVIELLNRLGRGQGRTPV